MTYQTYEPPRGSVDPLAVALGNATLFGIGYVLLRRWRPAAIAVLGSAVLLDLTATTADSRYEILLLLWWAAGTAHGWFLARRSPEHAVRLGQRAGTLALALAVVLTAALLRVDAYRIENRVTEARESGDCETAVAAQGEVWWGHRLAGAPVVEPGDAVVRACHRLAGAASTLARAARTGSTEDLGRGFGTLAEVLNDGPGNEPTVRAALDTFLDALPTDDSCDTAALTAWLRDRGRSHDVLDRSADAAARTEPAALVGCGDHLLAEDAWPQAREHYQQLLDTYPDDPRTAEARGGVRKATLAIELAEVRGLVDDTSDASSGYCAEPAKYSGAPPHRKGSGRALFLGDSEYTDRLPRSWRTGDPAKAALVVCAGEAENGAAVETCRYENKKSRYLPHQVTFHKVKIPVKVYELRTGKRLDPRSVQIGGSSCPSVLRYEYYMYDLGPGDQFVSTSKSAVRDAFRPVVGR
ncbi:tol-pal system YbgF family protein [Streptomyces sp. NPDC093598]|uniref:tetratricopeptide repeat protein n=1 Tax=Streptomyces sp. NPDC093598 TaxID=3366046 RepID=UPI0038125AA3